MIGLWLRWVEKRLNGLRDRMPESWFSSYAISAILYVVSYVALDRISFLHPFSEVGITPWDPPQGLTLAVLLRYGLRFAPVVPVAVFIAEILVRHVPAPWLPMLPTLTSALITAGGYVGAAWLLLRVVKINPNLRRQDDVVRLLIVSLCAAFLVAFGTAGNFLAFHMIALADFWPATLRSWLGDSVGILTLTPAFLVFTCGEISSRFGGRGWFVGAPLVEMATQVAAIVATVWFVFGVEHGDQLKLFYLLFIPAIWVTVRHGLAGAAVVVLLTELSLKVAFQMRGFGAPTVIDFQMMMLALGLTSLLVGAIVSERWQFNQALKESESRVKAILHTAPDAILTLDDEAHIQSVNPTAERMFGWSSNEIVGMPVTALLPDLMPDRDRPLSEYMGQRRDGNRFPAEVTVGHATAGSRQYTIAIARDISRRVAAETQVRQHQVELAHVDRISIVGEMASAILHEESQPLAAIAAYTRACRLLLQSPDVDMKKVAQSLDKLAAQTLRAGDILNRMRDFLHRGEIKPESTPVLELVSEVAEFAKIDLTEHDVRLKFDIEPGVPNVMADRVHIQQVLLNLVRNAVEALSESASPVREIWLYARHKGKRVVFEVRDTGPGISATIAEKLFTPFISSKNRGMGLGLSISRTIVAAHTGHLRHVPNETSSPGTTFAFDLPIASFKPVAPFSSRGERRQ